MGRASESPGLEWKAGHPGGRWCLGLCGDIPVQFRRAGAWVCGTDSRRRHERVGRAAAITVLGPVSGAGGRGLGRPQAAWPAFVPGAVVRLKETEEGPGRDGFRRGAGLGTKADVTL